MSEHKLSQAWLKGAVIGSLWASSEIILGSFLHNLKVPFSGTILGAIGVILLVSSHKLWKEKGMVWRAGIVCAIAKTLSPSPNIFGPMISIAAEAFLLEGFIRLFGGNLFGYVIGGGAAVSWSFFYKIISMIITYGFNIVMLYKNLYKYAMKQLNLDSAEPIILVLILFGIYFISGIVAGIIGYTLSVSKKDAKEIIHAPYYPLMSSGRINQKFNIHLLYLHLVLIISAIAFFNAVPLWIVSALAAVYVIFCLFQYGNNLKRIRKPKMWIVLLFIIFLSAFVLHGLGDEEKIISISGLLIGIEMSVRAVFMIFAFSALSIEFRNPKVEQWFKRKGMGQLSIAAEASFAILPFMIGSFNEQKEIFRHPLKAAAHIISQTDYWLERFEDYLKGDSVQK